MHQILCIAGIVLLMSSCSVKKNDEKAEDEKIVGFYKGDPDVQKAFEKAQEELPNFIGEFNRYSSDPEYLFYVKTRFAQGETVEHMWSYIIELPDNKVKCVLDNEPRDLTNVSLGDTLQVDFEEIEDLILLKGDSILMGNYLSKQMESKDSE